MVCAFRPRSRKTERRLKRNGRKLTKSQSFKYTPAPGALVALTSLPLNRFDGRIHHRKRRGWTTSSLNPASEIRSTLYCSTPSCTRSRALKPAQCPTRAHADSCSSCHPPPARFGVSNISGSKQNIEGGARYMKFLLDLFSGDVSLALAGLQRRAKELLSVDHGYIVPHGETREYVRRIGRDASLIRDPEAAANANHLTRAPGC